MPFFRRVHPQFLLRFIKPFVLIFHKKQRLLSGPDLPECPPYRLALGLGVQQQFYTEDIYKEYIYDSAETVGLMCLCIFCEGDKTRYDQLIPAAESLGSAFQKVNFLRDIKNDHQLLNALIFLGSILIILRRL